MYTYENAFFVFLQKPTPSLRYLLLYVARGECLLLHSQLQHTEHIIDHDAMIDFLVSVKNIDIARIIILYVPSTLFFKRTKKTPDILRPSQRHVRRSLVPGATQSGCGHGAPGREGHLRQHI